MTKNEYLSELSRALKAVSAQERKKSLDYYSELIDDRMDEGIPEETAVAEMESVASAGERIIAEAREQGNMKQGLKPWAIILIVAVSLAVLSLCVFVGLRAFSLVDSVFSVESSSAPSSESVTSNKNSELMETVLESEGQTFNFELVSSNIVIGSSGDNKIYLKYANSKSTWYDYSDQDGVVSLNERHPAVTNIFSGLDSLTELVANIISDSNDREPSMGKHQVQLLLPEGFDGSIDLNSVSGEIGVSGLTLLGEHRFMTVSGDIKLADGSCDSVRLYTTSGEIYLRRISGDTAEIETVSGDIELALSDYNSYIVNSVSGDMDGSVAGTSDDYTVFFSSVSGDNDLARYRGRGDRTIDFTSVSGDLDLEFGTGSHDKD